MFKHGLSQESMTCRRKCFIIIDDYVDSDVFVKLSVH